MPICIQNKLAEIFEGGDTYDTKDKCIDMAKEVVEERIEELFQEPRQYIREESITNLILLISVYGSSLFDLHSKKESCKTTE